MSNNKRSLSANDFVLKEKVENDPLNLSAISLFSGGALSDLGYEEAGFKFYVQAELDKRRAKLCQENFSNSTCIIGDIKLTSKKIVEAYQQKNAKGLALLSITPPCQGMSSSNPGRGKASEATTSDERNTLLLESVPVIDALKPRIIVVENVPQLINRMVRYENEEDKLFEIFKRKIEPQYHLFSKVVQMADYGIPQDRKRAVLVAIRVDEPCLATGEKSQLSPFPLQTHARQQANGFKQWITVKEWITQMGYPELDAKSPETAKNDRDSLHFVPFYNGDRYLMVADIPKNSGKNAYENSICHECGHGDVPADRMYCPYCRKALRNRPYVKTKGKYRLIKGFTSSYRRMYPDRPSATITTASSHIGSDFKIHPWENRVLSARECADIQTIPRYYDWSWALQSDHKYIIRQIIGEALPPWFTYQHGLVLGSLLETNQFLLDSI